MCPSTDIMWDKLLTWQGKGTATTCPYIEFITVARQASAMILARSAITRPHVLIRLIAGRRFDDLGFIPLHTQHAQPAPVHPGFQISRATRQGQYSDLCPPESQGI